MSELKLLVHFV